MKNEGWGFKEDQIPSSSHCLHQTMGSRLHFLLSLPQPANWLVASYLHWYVARLSVYGCL